MFNVWIPQLNPNGRRWSQRMPKNLSTTLQLFPYVLSPLFNLVVIFRLPISSPQLCASNSGRRTVNRPFTTYDCPPTDTVAFIPHSNLLHNCRVESTWKRRNGYRLVVGWRQSHLRPRSSKTLDLCHTDASATSRLGLSQPVEMARSREGEGIFHHRRQVFLCYCCC